MASQFGACRVRWAADALISRPLGTSLASFARPGLFSRRFSSPAAAAAAAAAAPAETPVYITTPIFYVNDRPHLGHAYTAVLADAAARFHRLQGRKVALLSGTDEHGIKIQNSFTKHNIPGKAWVTHLSTQFQAMVETMGVEYDVWGRTTEAAHVDTVVMVWNRLAELGYLYKGEHEGWYSPADEAFVTAVEVNVVEPKQSATLKTTGQTVHWVSEPCYKFRLSAFREFLLDWLTAPETREAVLPASRRNELLNFLNGDEGEAGSGGGGGKLDDLSVSRLKKSVSWAIEVPGDPEHTVYVWFDALLVYIAYTQVGAQGSQMSPALQATLPQWPASLQVLGKDIGRFHCLIWPAMLHAFGLPVTQRFLVHGHWTVSGGQKMSKSLKNVVDPMQLVATYGLDAVRLFLLQTASSDCSDHVYSSRDLMNSINGFLTNNFLNLVNRSTSSNLLMDLPLPLGQPPTLSASTADPLTAELLEDLRTFADRAAAEYSSCDFAGVFDLAQATLDRLNLYFTAKQPWALAKGIREGEPDSAAANPTTEELRSQLAEVTYVTMEGIRIVAICLQPCLPQAMGRVLTRVGVPADQRTWSRAGIWLELVSKKQQAPAYLPNPVYYARSHRLTVPDFQQKLG